MIILIIDDESTKSRAIATVIDSVSKTITIRTAETAQQARELMIETKFDLVILDLVLPNNLTSQLKQETGLTLLTEIIDDDTLIEPNKVFCLTGVPKVLEDYKDVIEDQLVTLHRFSFSESRWKTALISEINRQLKPKTLEEIKSYNVDFLMVTALKETELKHLLKLDFNWGAPELFDDNILIHKGEKKIGDKTHTFIATLLPKMGPVSCAVLTSKLIEKLRPRYVVMTGICAGIQSETKIGDIILASSSWSWENGKWSTKGNERVFEVEPHPINIDPRISTLYEIAFKERSYLFDLHENYEGTVKPDRIPKTIIGSLACGSSVISNQSLLDAINIQDRKMKGLDMESYGLYYASFLASTPKPTFFCLKAVCDFADSTKGDNFQDYAAYMSAKVFEKFVLSLY
ncbi:MAG: nucleoside phosphorylase/CheY-like chemotaxis protein [Colwellia sp.]